MEGFKNIKLTFDCPKELDELTPCGGGWDCSTCQKMVHDFRGMTETEILNIFAKSDTPLCGVYDAERFVVPVKKIKWQKWLSAAMMTVGLSWISPGSYAQQGNNKVSENVPKQVRTDTARTRTITIGAVSAPQMAEYPGGDEALRSYLRKHINNKEGFTGLMGASFTVEADGSIDDVMILRSGGVWMDTDMKRALQNSKKWTPVYAGGTAISSKCTAWLDFSKPAQ